HYPFALSKGASRAPASKGWDIVVAEGDGRTAADEISMRAR
ncbi:MAG: hypothetical protein RL199_240, partial [Pseudomonadota bacterium]